MAAVVRDVDLARLIAPRRTAGIERIDLARIHAVRDHAIGALEAVPDGGERRQVGRGPACAAVRAVRRHGVGRCPDQVVAGRDRDALHVALAGRGAGRQGRELVPAAAGVARPERLDGVAVLVVDAGGGDVGRVGPRQVGRVTAAPPVHGAARRPRREVRLRPRADVARAVDELVRRAGRGRDEGQGDGLLEVGDLGTPGGRGRRGIRRFADAAAVDVHDVVAVGGVDRDALDPAGAVGRGNAGMRHVGFGFVPGEAVVVGQLDQLVRVGPAGHAQRDAGRRAGAGHGQAGEADVGVELELVPGAVVAGAEFVEIAGTAGALGLGARGRIGVRAERHVEIAVGRTHDVGNIVAGHVGRDRNGRPRGAAVGGLVQGRRQARRLRVVGGDGGPDDLGRRRVLALHERGIVDDLPDAVQVRPLEHGLARETRELVPGMARVRALPDAGLARAVHQRRRILRIDRQAFAIGPGVVVAADRERQVVVCPGVAAVAGDVDAAGRVVVHAVAGHHVDELVVVRIEGQAFDAVEPAFAAAPADAVGDGDPRRRGRIPAVGAAHVGAGVQQARIARVVDQAGDVAAAAPLHARPAGGGADGRGEDRCCRAGRAGGRAAAAAACKQRRQQRRDDEVVVPVHGVSSRWMILTFNGGPPRPVSGAAAVLVRVRDAQLSWCRSGHDRFH